ncbi:MAG: hypothetical protein HC893_07385 [Chloroflexaceae bacterium]|nr:hypothetical protein [Chloroflexaceae bacterium]NJL33702.1 hypothetical protein [Chloroflexaceae bacterium]
MRYFTILAPLLCLAIVLSGCGTIVNAPSQGAFAADVPTPTIIGLQDDLPPNLPDEKRDFLEREQRLVQTHVARQTDHTPSPITMPPTVSPVPQQIRPTGIFEDCREDYYQYIRIENCWWSIFGQTPVRVWAGADLSETSHGLLILLSTTAEGKIGEPTFYTTPTNHGAIEVIGADGPVLQVQAEDGTRFDFDVLERTWLPTVLTPTP